MPDAATASVSVTVRDAITRAAQELDGAGCDTARLDAELLLAAVLGVDRARLVVDARASLDPSAERRFAALVGRRAQREPVAYIVGRKPFRHLNLTVNANVLIPRPETEMLVEAGLGLPSGARVADVGTGSGAVALALKSERPDLTVFGIDISEPAVVVARANAGRLGLDVAFEVGDLLAGQACDAVLANLPYVADGTELAPEITGFEPPGAVFAGADGLDLVRRLVPMLSGVAFVALEIGFDQGAAVSALLREGGFGTIECRQDLAGHDRVIAGRR